MCEQRGQIEMYGGYRAAEISLDLLEVIYFSPIPANELQSCGIGQSCY